MPESERKSTLKVIHMEHYAIDKMNLPKEQSTGLELQRTSKTPTTSVKSVQNLPGANKGRCCSLKKHRTPGGNNLV